MKIRVKNIYIIIFFIVVIILIIGYYSFIRIQQKNAYNYLEMSSDDWIVEDIYKEYPNIFNFSEDGECIITISELLKGQDEYNIEIMHDKEGNDCVGYYIINKDLDNQLDIDSSHICDMIDY